MLKSSSIGKISVNINGDLSYDEIVKRAELIQQKGVKIVWVGEFEGFLDPFEVAEVIASRTSLYVGFGIVSPLRRSCKEIREKFLELVDRFGNRFILGIGAGEFNNAADAFRIVADCIDELSDLSVVVGCTSPKITAFSSQYADGILFNSVHPEIVQWLRSYLKSDVFTAAYGPSLLLPSEFEEDLLIAASIILSGSRKLVEKFELNGVAKRIAGVDIAKLIDVRRSGGSIAELHEAKPLFECRDLLLEKFTISGSFDNIVARVRELLKLCDHVVLADPFFRDIKSIEVLDRLVVECEKL